MRAFQPIARRTEAERNRNCWVPPTLLRRLAWYIVAGASAYEVISGARLASYLLAAQSTPGYQLTHPWPGSPLQIVAPIAIILCIPFLTARTPQPRKKHVPDPALSIRPR